MIEQSCLYACSGAACPIAVLAGDEVAATICAVKHRHSQCGCYALGIGFHLSKRREVMSGASVASSGVVAASHIGFRGGIVPLFDAQQVEHSHRRPCVVILIMHAAIELPHRRKAIRSRGKGADLCVPRQIIYHYILRSACLLIFLDYGIEVDVSVGRLMRDDALGASLTIGGASATVG